jgi:hypothetical protein
MLGTGNNFQESNGAAWQPEYEYLRPSCNNYRNSLCLHMRIADQFIFAGHSFDQHSNSVSFLKGVGLYFKFTAYITCSVLLCYMEASFKCLSGCCFTCIMVLLSLWTTIPNYIKNVALYTVT